MVNLTDFAHVPWVLAIQLIGLVLIDLLGVPRAKLPWASALTGLAGNLVVFAREVTQAEYRWIETHGGLRAAMPDFIGFDVLLWNRHSLLETLWPILATALVVGAVLIYTAILER